MPFTNTNINVAIEELYRTSCR